MEENKFMQVVIDPKLELTPTNFAEAWNNSPKCGETAHAVVKAQTEEQFIDPMLVETGVVVLEALTVGLLSNAIWDLAKELLLEQGVHKKATYKEIVQPNGTHTIIVTIEKG